MKNALVVAFLLLLVVAIGHRLSVPVLAQSRLTLSSPFTRRVLATSTEAPFDLPFFTTAVKSDSRGGIITGRRATRSRLWWARSSPVSGPDSCAIRRSCSEPITSMGGRIRTRIDPNNPEAASGNQHWPNVPQPFRSWPNALALTPIRGQALHCAGRTRRLSRLARRGGRHSEPNGQTVDRSAAGGIAEGDPTDGNSLVTTNTAVFIRPYAVVLNEYANLASVIDTGSDTVVGEFQTGFYGEDLVFNATGTRLYLTDRFKDQVRAFRIDPGPTFTQIAEIPTGRSDLERANPRDLDLSPDGRTLYAANTLGHTIAVIDVAGDANILRGNLVVGGLATDVRSPADGASCQATRRTRC
jgi:DNA-binding beta-propeller fold protein YncE